MPLKMVEERTIMSHSNAPIAHVSDATKDRLFETVEVNSMWDYSTSSLIASTHLIQNPHLPIAYNLHVTSVEQSNNLEVPSNDNDPFLAAGMFLGTGELVSVIPFVVPPTPKYYDMKSGIDRIFGNDTHLICNRGDRKSSLFSEGCDFDDFADDEGAECDQDALNQLSESQKISSTNSAQDKPDLSSSPSPPTPRAVFLESSMQTADDMSTQHRRRSLVPCGPTPPQRPSHSAIADDETAKNVGTDVEHLKRVTFCPIHKVVEIPSRLTKEELLSQQEEAGAEALDEAATAEEEESDAAFTAFKARYQCTEALMSFTSFEFGFGRNASSQEERNDEDCKCRLPCPVSLKPDQLAAQHTESDLNNFN